ncbi:kinase-like domain-containing protein [Paraphoma chrysanthemicola]|nr:kinase-like domain-containing protein [Paraphoma chrysanthemicola]
MDAAPLYLVEGQDYVIQERSELPFQYLAHLGHGLSASVDKVRDVNTGAVYACKTFHVYTSRRHQITWNTIENELKILWRLREHHHILRVVATFRSRREVGIILQPVADQGDLEDFLAVYWESIHDGDPPHIQDPSTKILCESFVCLAGVLEFLHSQRIRHKDIKPGNILIHHGAVLYTDFDFSLDWTPLDCSTTTGMPDAFTRAAPEVLNHSPRNSKTDIFSLGCVFLELLSAL